MGEVEYNMDSLGDSTMKMGSWLGFQCSRILRVVRLTFLSFGMDLIRCAGKNRIVSAW